jgi:hypothetical protein
MDGSFVDVCSFWWFILGCREIPFWGDSRRMQEALGEEESVLEISMAFCHLRNVNCSQDLFI